ncbi:MAG TPA: D-amino-acid transaminase [Parvularculaceae bacterium]|nr:D-amino-acid transaminase [Parvularculaceae bacterium]HNS86117.1 D-amino-acid transaminase [Parvularculaceae bacterium]
MPRIAYVNGAYRPLKDAFVHIEDRGYQFADGIYEVALRVDGRFWDLDGHLARWGRSLKELNIAEPMSERALRLVIGRLIAKNRLGDCYIYMQATRGVAPRNHPFPLEGTRPSLVMTVKPLDLRKLNLNAQKGISVITEPDIRWGRVDIKSVGLLPNILAKEKAKRQGSGEAWLVRNGKVTEGGSSNAWIVDEDGALITHPLGNEILGGITRQTVIRCAEELQLRVVERPFTVDEAKNAKEAFITSAMNLVTPVIAVDGARIGNGKPGPIALRLREAYYAHNAA